MRLFLVSILGLVMVGCAGVYIPPGSRPLNAVQPYKPMPLESLLPGTWTVVGDKTSNGSTALIPNLLRRSAEVAGVNQWHSFTFEKQSQLRVTGDANKTDVLDYHVEGNELHLGPHAPHAEHDPWEVTYQDHELLLRSLADGETITLTKQ